MSVGAAAKVVRVRRGSAFLLVAWLAGLSPAAALDGEAAFRALAAPGAVALLRHATAPGLGDPAHFRLGDCATQRNLSAAGRDEAAAIGARLRRHAIAPAVHSSQWCRCLETARLLALGPVTPQPLLNSFFARPADELGQMAALRAWIATQPVDRPLLLVTHQVVITALTGIVPRSGEIVVVERDGDGALTVRGRIPPP